METHIVIMAGGIGSRFWPMSTPECPKQFIDVTGCGKSLIQLTVERFQGLCIPDNIWIVTSEKYKETVMKQLPSVPPHHILTEPIARNTAPCITYACWKIKKHHPDANIVVTPADALVINTDDFFNRRAIRNIQEKQGIAQKALRLIQPDTAIFLDSGSTTTELARLFPDQSNLIYTTGLSCATELAGLEKPVIMLPGGRLNRYSISTYGTMAIQELEHVNFHQTFLGITGYTLQAGFTCGSIEEALLKRTAMKQADQVIVLMDSSKVGVKRSYSICSMADVDLVISDGHLPQDVLAECERHRIPVL